MQKRTQKPIPFIFFYFAENFLLPYMFPQTLRLHFVTDLKFDLFGLYCSNFGRILVYCLAEDHCSSHKTESEVFPVIQHCVGFISSGRTTEIPIRHLILHTDNFGGQTKNRFVLWYICWLSLDQGHEFVVQHSLVVFHTRHRYEGSFKLIKRKLHRCTYLEKSVVEPYFGNNTSIRSTHFKSGSSFRI